MCLLLQDKHLRNQVYMSGGTSGLSTNPSEKLLRPVAAGGVVLDVSSGPSLVLWRGTMLARLRVVFLLGSTSSRSGTLFFLLGEKKKSETITSDSFNEVSK